MVAPQAVARATLALAREATIAQLGLREVKEAKEAIEAREVKEVVEVEVQDLRRPKVTGSQPMNNWISLQMIQALLR